MNGEAAARDAQWDVSAGPCPRLQTIEARARSHSGSRFESGQPPRKIAGYESLACAQPVFIGGPP